MIHPKSSGRRPHQLSEKPRGWSTNPSNVPPPRNKGLIAGLIKGNLMVNKPLIRPAISAGGRLGGVLVDQS